MLIKKPPNKSKPTGKGKSFLKAVKCQQSHDDIKQARSNNHSLLWWVEGKAWRWSCEPVQGAAGLCRVSQAELDRPSANLLTSKSKVDWIPLGLEGSCKDACQSSHLLKIYFLVSLTPWNIDLTFDVRFSVQGCVFVNFFYVKGIVQPPSDRKKEEILALISEMSATSKWIFPPSNTIS